MVRAVVILGLCCLIMAARGPVTWYLYYVDGAFWLVVLLRLAISAAGGITREKENGAWPILLTTPLDDRQIVRTKALAALRQNAIVILAGLALHVCFIVSVGLSSPPYARVIYPLASTFARIISALFVVCAGLYFGVRMRTTTAAAAAAFGAHLFLNYLVGGQLINMAVQLYWNPSRASSRLQVLYALSFVIGMGLAVLNVALSMFLLRRARQNLRRCIF